VKGTTNTKGNAMKTWTWVVYNRGGEEVMRGSEYANADAACAAGKTFCRATHGYKGLARNVRVEVVSVADDSELDSKV